MNNACLHPQAWEQVPFRKVFVSNCFRLKADANTVLRIKIHVINDIAFNARKGAFVGFLKRTQNQRNYAFIIFMLFRADFDLSVHKFSYSFKKNALAVAQNSCRKSLACNHYILHDKVKAT